VQLPLYLGILASAEQHVADALTLLADRHSANAEVRDTARLLARWSRRHLEALREPIARYGVRDVPDPERLRSGLLHGARVGGLGLLRDVHDVLALATYLRGAWVAVYQAAMELHDTRLAALGTAAGEDVDRQIAWLKTRLRLVAPQALTVPPDRMAAAYASLPTTPTPAALPEIVWAPVAGAVLLAVVGLLALLFRQAWLLPSLGPSVYLLAQMPAHPAGRMYNVVAGHLLGVAAGIAAVWLTGAAGAPIVLETGELTGARVGAATLAVGLTLLVTLALRAGHPPAAATTLLVALGSLRLPSDVVNVAAGAVVVALAGAVVRRLRLGRWPRRTVSHEPGAAGEAVVTRPAAAEMKKAA
jgi:hypothetical protein